jgi:hypothetical protein
MESTVPDRYATRSREPPRYEQPARHGLIMARSWRARLTPISDAGHKRSPTLRHQIVAALDAFAE